MLKTFEQYKVNGERRTKNILKSSEKGSIYAPRPLLHLQVLWAGDSEVKMGQKRIESTLSFKKLVHELHGLRDQYERNSISKGDFRKKY